MTKFQHFPENSEVKFAVHRLLDSVWVLAYKPVLREKIEIVYYADLTPFGRVIEPMAPALRLIEGSNRKIESVQISDHVFDVVNPRYIFNYRLVTELSLSSLLFAAMHSFNYHAAMMRSE